MKTTLGAAVILIACAGGAQAQDWMYQSRQGTQPFIYDGPSYGAPVYSGPQSFGTPLPTVPDVLMGINEGPGPYGTALPTGPVGYPCTIPGCR